MRKALLFFLSLVLMALVGWSTVGADDGFYVIPCMRGNYAPVPKTGQTTPSDTGTDGALRKGVAWPTPRFTDNNNGTVTDNLTKLIWMKNAGVIGLQTWDDALSIAATLGNGTYDLTDGSNQGDWRLPNLRELQSLVDIAFSNPALPNTMGTGVWEEGTPFQGVQSDSYWSSSTAAGSPTTAWYVFFYDGFALYTDKVNNSNVWCVRGGP